MYAGNNPVHCNTEGNAMKVGIIRCQQTEDICPGTTDLKCAAAGKGAFAELGPCEVVGFVSCGGCPGKRAASRAQTLVARGAEAVALATCITKGSPMDFPCPNRDAIRNSIAKALDDSVVFLEYTH